MSGSKAQASPPAVSGKALRRARNIVKRYRNLDRSQAKIARRYNRAVTLLAWDALTKA